MVGIIGRVIGPSQHPNTPHTRTRQPPPRHEYGHPVPRYAHTHAHTLPNANDHHNAPARALSLQAVPHTRQPNGCWQSCEWSNQLPIMNCVPLTAPVNDGLSQAWFGARTHQHAATATIRTLNRGVLPTHAHHVYAATISMERRPLWWAFPVVWRGSGVMWAVPHWAGLSAAGTTRTLPPRHAPSRRHTLG